MIKYEIWLQAVLSEGSDKVLKVLEYYKNAESVYDAGTLSLKNSGLFTPAALKRAENTSLKYAEDIIELCRKNDIKIITLESPSYPDSLRHIANPPLVLYIKGELPDFSAVPSITIVGPRKVSDFGEKSAYSLSNRLSKAGFTIVSGGAVGGDRAAHIGALKANGKTVLVLPCGILCGYLKENEKLRSAVLKNGCLLSEYPPEKPVGRSSFTVRNRILAALTPGTVIIEAGEKSGVLITAGYACEYGKDLFVIPGNPTYPQYKGSNALIRDGAKPLLNAFDVFNEYLPAFSDKIDIENAFSKSSGSENKEKTSKKLPLTLSNEAKMVYNQLDKQKFSVDDLLSSGISDDSLISAVTELEMEHLIKSLPGGLYEKL